MFFGIKPFTACRARFHPKTRFGSLGTLIIASSDKQDSQSVLTGFKQHTRMLTITVCHLFLDESRPQPQLEVEDVDMRLADDLGQEKKR